LTAAGVDIRKNEVNFYPFVEESKFLFSKKIHQEMEALWRGVDEIVELQRRPTESSVAQARLQECERRILRIKEIMQPYLRQ